MQYVQANNWQCVFFKLILVLINYQQRNIFHSGKKTKQGKQSKKKKLLKNKNKKKESKEQIKTYLLKPFKPKKTCNYQLRIHTLHQDMFSPNMREPITLLMLC